MDVVTPVGDRAVEGSETIVGDSPPQIGEKLTAFLDLTKPRITVLVVLSALAGFALGSPHSIDWIQFFHTAVGVALLSSGIAALNQYLERDLDALMQRTKNRPLPTQRLTPGAALGFGVAISAVAGVYLATYLNPLTAFWGFVAFSSYLFLYTPLKTRTSWCTFIGAFPGAIPPLLGWTAARNEMGIEALILFGILFFWQFPHFHAISTMYREDYGEAGIKMLPVVEPDGRSTARQIVGFTIALVVVSLLPPLFHFSGWIYFAGAVILGAWFLSVSVDTARRSSREQARRLLKASVLYLPLLLALLVWNR
jgi:heme o synthase